MERKIMVTNTWKNASVYFELEEIKDTFVRKIKEWSDFDKDNLRLIDVSGLGTGYYVTIAFTDDDDDVEWIVNNYIDYLYKHYAEN